MRPLSQMAGASIVIQDPGGLALTTTEYDAEGRSVKQLAPGATGTDAATRVTTYWSATGTGTGACTGRPEWPGALPATAWSRLRHPSTGP